MIRKLKKQFTLLFAGSFSMVLAACYGMPVDMEFSKSVKTVNETNEAIPGLKVQLTNNGERVLEDFTDENGYVYYSFFEEGDANDYKVIISDVDGLENGGAFSSTVVDLIDSQNIYIAIMSQ